MTILVVIATGQVLRRLVQENEAHLKQQETFNAELQHRTKNALQIMRALIARGPRGEDPASYFETLAGRLDALAKANELLRFGALESAELGAMIKAAISPFDAARFELDGPPCQVARQAVTPLMLALHELCTNSTKYGALSVDAGMVAVKWGTAGDAAHPGIELVWRETGGPRVRQPTHRGLGTRLLTPHSGLAAVHQDWRPEGLVCSMTVIGA
nr:sensor histidine kinase [Novosphingobium flavum]